MKNSKVKMIAMFLTIVLTFSFCSLSIGCKKQEPASYWVVSFDKGSGLWTIISTGTFGGKLVRKRLTVVCDSSQRSDLEAVHEPEACELNVGRIYVPNPSPKEDQQSTFLDIGEMPADRLWITEGTGEDKVSQQFIIEKSEVLPGK